MTQAKHTPGPWIKDGLQWYGSDGSVVIVSDGPSFGSASCFESAEANARLIAAAPELLSLLKEARSTLEMWKDVAPAVSLCADIDKSIAKATGASND